MNTAPAVRTMGAKPITMMKMRYARSSAMARTPYSPALGYHTPDGFPWHVLMHAAVPAKDADHQTETSLFLSLWMEGLLLLHTLGRSMMGSLRLARAGF